MTAIPTNPLCHGDHTGYLSLVGHGGSGAQYSFLVSSKKSYRLLIFLLLSIIQVNGNKFSDSGLVANLGAGSYDIVAQDGNGCSSSPVTSVLNDPKSITILSSLLPFSPSPSFCCFLPVLNYRYQLAGINISTYAVAQQCYGTNTGSITVLAEGGAGSFAFSVRGRGSEQMGVVR